MRSEQNRQESTSMAKVASHELIEIDENTYIQELSIIVGEDFHVIRL